MELNELVVDKNQEMHWRETARWIKFEEDVEEDTARWGKPHVASLSFRSLLELRKTIAHGKSEIALCFWPGFVYCPGTSFAGQLLLPFGCSLKTCQQCLCSGSLLDVGRQTIPQSVCQDIAIAQGCLRWLLALLCCPQARGTATPSCASRSWTHEGKVLKLPVHLGLGVFTVFSLKGDIFSLDPLRVRAWSAHIPQVVGYQVFLRLSACLHSILWFLWNKSLHRGHGIPGLVAFLS